MAVDILSRYITSDPNTFGGKPCIAGRRIRVVDVAIWHEKFGWSPDTIASKFNLTLPEIHAALAYYFENREAFEAEIRAEAAHVAAIEENYPSKLSGEQHG